VTVLVAGLLVAAVPTSSAQVATDSFVTMISEPGDWVGGGQTRFYHPDNASITIGGNAGYVTVSVSGGNLGDSFSFDFAAPPGQELREGEYIRAQRAPFREATRPGIDIGGDGRGCNEISGRFIVKRITKDPTGRVTSLWVVYEQHCEGGPVALFGEVRYQVPDTAGTALTLGPSVVRWPDVDLNGAARVVPVTVYNPGSAGVPLGTASIGGPDAGTFSVRIDECAGKTLGAKEACVVFVRFVASEAGVKTATLRIPETSGFVHEVPLSAFVYGGITRLQMAGGYIGGSGYSYDTTNAQFSVRGSYDGVRGWIEGADGGWWSVEFYPPAGDVLAPNTTYTNARRAAFRGPAAGIDVSGSGRGCNEIDGTFTVSTISVNQFGELLQFGVRFEQRCDGESQPLRGVFDFRVGSATEPPEEPGPTEPPPSEPPPTEPPSEPPPEDEEHVRSVSLVARAHKVMGTVSVADDVMGCYARVPVRLQRRVDGAFKTFAMVETDLDGHYSRKIRRRGAIYRAVAPAVMLSDGSICTRAESSARQ
jgi:hypothetical protein